MINHFVHNYTLKYENNQNIAEYETEILIVESYNIIFFHRLITT